MDGNGPERAPQKWYEREFLEVVDVKSAERALLWGSRLMSVSATALSFAAGYVADPASVNDGARLYRGLVLYMILLFVSGSATIYVFKLYGGLEKLSDKLRARKALRALYKAWLVFFALSIGAAVVLTPWVKIAPELSWALTAADIAVGLAGEALFRRIDA